MCPKSCPEFERCSANLCPLDTAWSKRTYTDPDAICLYLREVVKPVAQDILNTEEHFAIATEARKVLTKLRELKEQNGRLDNGHGRILLQVDSRAKSGSTLVRRAASAARLKALSAPPPIQQKPSQEQRAEPVECSIDYDTGAIVILTPQEAAERHPFAAATDLIARYPTKPPEFISRLVQACVEADYPIHLAEQRYLKGDKSIQPTEELLRCHKNLQSQQHRKMDWGI